MKVSELNESVLLIESDGVMVYLDPENKTFRIADPDQSATKKGLQKLIKNERDLEKISRTYRKTDDDTLDLISAFIDVDTEAYRDAQNKFKKKNPKREREFTRALSSMQRDILRLSKEK